MTDLYLLIFACLLIITTTVSIFALLIIIVSYLRKLLEENILAIS